MKLNRSAMGKGYITFDLWQINIHRAPNKDVLFNKNSQSLSLKIIKNKVFITDWNNLWIGLTWIGPQQICNIKFLRISEAYPPIACKKQLAIFNFLDYPEQFNWI